MSKRRLRKGGGLKMIICGVLFAILPIAIISAIFIPDGTYDKFEKQKVA